VVSLAEGFGLDTVAEGVEDGASFALLNGFGVTHAQGYLCGRPGPIEDVLSAPGAATDEKPVGLALR
jgi:EAL domain-containing protein (putative c-di-GMP-specific phosphodiesterase class I)